MSKYRYSTPLPRNSGSMQRFPLMRGKDDRPNGRDEQLRSCLDVFGIDHNQVPGNAEPRILPNKEDIVIAPVASECYRFGGLIERFALRAHGASTDLDLFSVGSMWERQVDARLGYEPEHVVANG